MLPARLLLRQRLPVRLVRALSLERPQPSEALGPEPGEALPAAPRDTAPKQYSAKVRQLVQDIAGLTLLEVAELNELLKQILKIPDVGMMPMVPAAAPSGQVAEDEEVASKPEKLNFTVKLVSLKVESKVKLIKEVKNLKEGLNLVQAKKLVESLPQEIKANISKDEAEKIKATLEAVGGSVVLE
ncbi:large ribosomal subunit protein bL12m [Alligator mississippiensis]|uniref:large ribosomal subunit protein bL12m n=1 Tax=Alligator mississippiensis TaxID=8496 RepID=UPI0003D0EC3A|nr:large ribosomal subunit protein bL12m [Alligator mississippiensis]